jgi:hypothetical protein
MQCVEASQQQSAMLIAALLDGSQWQGVRVSGCQHFASCTLSLAQPWFLPPGPHQEVVFSSRKSRLPTHLGSV